MLRHKITKIVDRLPLFPIDIDNLLQASVKPTKNNIKILHKIVDDPELWSSVMEAAGSYYGKCDDVKTVEDAIDCCGMQPLVQLIGVAYARKAIQEEFSSLKYLNEYFDHGEYISIGCNILSRICNIPQQEQHLYITAGLVHDIGRLAIMVATQRTSAHVLGTLWDKMASVVYEEKLQLATDHCEVGREICKKWNFHPIIQESVSRHHTPIADGHFSFGGGIIFVSHFLSASDPSGDIISTFSPAIEVLSNLKLTSDDFIEARKIYNSRVKGNIK